MNKKTVLKFSVLFISLYVGFLTLAYVFNLTKFNRYEDTALQYYKYDYAFAKLINQKSMLASKDGKVKARDFSSGNPILDSAIWLGTNGAQTFGFYQNVTSDAPGFAKNQFNAVVDNVCDPLVGSNCTPCKEEVIKLRGTKDLTFASMNSDRCKMANGFFNKYVSSTSNNNQATNNAPLKNGGGLYALTNYLTGAVMVEYSDMTSLGLYARETTKEIPFMTKTAYAADTNFFDNMLWGTVNITALSQNFFNIWQLSRNLAYYLIIIPTIAVGFAIMFRMQIGPQTQVTLLQALPKLLIVMLLITFSYPISSVIIQLGKPITTVAIGIVQSALLAAPSTSGTLWDSGMVVGFPNIVASILLIIFGSSAFFLGGGMLGLLFVGVLLILFFIALVRYGVGIFMTIFKLSFLVAFSPLILLVAAFPGKEGIIKQYFLNLIAYVLGLAAIGAVFMAAYLCMVFAGVSNNVLAFLGFLIAGFTLLWKAGGAPQIIAQMVGVKPILGEVTGGGDPKRR